MKSVYRCECGSITGVIDSRAMENGLIRRRRHCTKCHERFSTVELRRDAYLRLKGINDTFEEMIEKIQKGL